MKHALTLALAGLCLLGQAQSKKSTSHWKQPAAAGTISGSDRAASVVSPLYTFSTFTAAYQPITGTSLTGGTKWDDADFTIPVGFNAKLYATQGTTINLAQCSFFTLNSLSSNTISIVTPIFDDMCDRAWDPTTSNEGDAGGISNISYTTTGTVGNQICVIQFSNAGFYGEIDANDQSLSFMNCQLWLYEATGDIEFRYGNVSILDPTDNLINPNGFICGMADQLDMMTGNSVASNVLNGPHNNPSMVALTSSLNEVITGTIQAGRVYKFSRVSSNPVGIAANSAAKNLSLYPNPATGKLFCNGDVAALKDATLQLYSLDGRQVLTKTLAAENDLSGISKGVYLVKVQGANAESLYTSKLVIAE